MACGDSAKAEPLFYSQARCEAFSFGWLLLRVLPPTGCSALGRCDLDAFLGHNLDDLVPVIPARLADHDLTTEIAIRRWGMNRTGFH